MRGRRQPVHGNFRDFEVADKEDDRAVEGETEHGAEQDAEHEAVIVV